MKEQEYFRDKQTSDLGATRRGLYYSQKRKVMLLFTMHDALSNVFIYFYNHIFV